jgi:lipopolysaccharide transport system permease protein
MRSVERDAWVENRPSHGLRGPDLKELWQYRELGGFLALRDLKVRYKQAVFGVAWAVLQPLAGVLVFTLVFRRLAKVPSDGIPYPLFAFAGLAAWSYHASSVTRATQSLVGNAPLVTKVYFPRLLMPLAAVLPGLVDLALSLLTLGVLMVIYGTAPGWELLTLPVWVGALTATSFGTGLWLSALNVQYRDVNQAIALFVQLWLFLSPVAYPSSMVRGGLRTVYALNPMVGVLEGFRWALLDGPRPAASMLLASTAVMLVLLVSGLLYFQRTERRFADVI